jgi:hypothetical protein
MPESKDLEVVLIDEYLTCRTNIQRLNSKINLQVNFFDGFWDAGPSAAPNQTLAQFAQPAIDLIGVVVHVRALCWLCYQERSSNLNRAVHSD